MYRYQMNIATTVYKMVYGYILSKLSIYCSFCMPTYLDAVKFVPSSVFVTETLVTRCLPFKKLVFIQQIFQPTQLPRACHMVSKAECVGQNIWRIQTSYLRGQ